MTKPRTYPDFLKSHTSPATPAYAEAEQWLKEGWTFERVIAEWHKGDDLLWLLEGVGAITRDEATKLACTCVDRCGVMAPDVIEISDAVRKGDMTAAAFGAAAIMGNAEGKEPDPKKPEAAVCASKAKANYAVTLLLDTRPYMVLSHAVKARSFEALDAWTKAVAAGESAQKTKVLEGLADYAEKSEHLAHADIVRAYFGGLK